MSKSFAHQPSWALFRNAALRQERHDHRFHGCDLPSVAEFLTSLKAHGRVLTACCYAPANEALMKSCGCRVCTQHDERRRQRRRSRHVSKTELRRSNVSFDD